MQVMLDRYIEIPQDGSWVRVAGSTTAIASIVRRHLHWNMPIAVIALIEELPPAAIHAAMAFYYDNQAIIDTQIAVLEAQPQPSISDLQQEFQHSLTASGYDSREKVMDLIRSVKLEILAEKEQASSSSS
jgi:hypothetical protein